MAKKGNLPYSSYIKYSEQEVIKRSQQYYQHLNRRRTIRDYSDEVVPLEVIKNCILTAGTAPNGAHHQPWHFAVVSDAKMKKDIRQAAEEEERKFYSGGVPEAWTETLKPLGTNNEKPFLDIAPHLIIVFAEKYGISTDGTKVKNYYVNESVGIATGLLVSAVHNAGLVSVTYTPLHMKFLNKILDRPKNERPFLILPVGYPAADVMVPNIKRKKLEEIASFF
ncbi:MAG: nitroreductase family protein [Proteobacteria bacterium]|nr:nitroreductase family protein [Pseudomonadota bacterium]